MKFALISVAVFLVLSQPVFSYREPLVGRDSIIDLADSLGTQAFDSISRQISGDPYNPGSFAWGWQYHARGCLIMYNLTGDRKWLDWAVNLTDHFLAYSDVNADGEPAWGNYNETWGNPRYDFREYTVWDGVIGLPIVEAAKVILSDERLMGNASLVAKAEAYIGLMERVVKRHHRSWTQAGPDQGYYWDDPYEDIGPIVNRFTALGRAELVLGDITQNYSYYENPRQMANYMIANMKYDDVDDLYTWEYWYGKGGAEDISHGAIELEFLIMANQRGLLDDVHLERLANTYLKRVYQVPEILESKHLLAMRVDGTDPPQYDYTSISRGWVLLAPYNPNVYESQRIVFGILNEDRGLYPSTVRLLGLAQIPLMASVLNSMGTDPDTLRVVDISTMEAMLAKVNDRIEDVLTLGSDAESAISLVNEAQLYINEESIYNASIAIGLMFNAWEMLGEIEETGLSLQSLFRDIDEAEILGVFVDDIKFNSTIIADDFSSAEKNSDLDEIDARIAAIVSELEKLVAETLIEMAVEVVMEAKNVGIDTSRHEIFLQRAQEEFEKGNYGPARQFTTYPLGLREAIPELKKPLAFFLTISFLVLPFLFFTHLKGIGNREALVMR